MECTKKMKPVLALVLLLSCHLLLPLVSSVPVSRSVALGNHQASASSLTLEAVPVQDRRLSLNYERSTSLVQREHSRCLPATARVHGVATTADEEQSVVGEVVARMDIEVNDYPGSSANGRHEPPRSSGRG